MMLISLYTVRITLQILGADDYGIYNAVAGIIGFIGFISATLTNAAQRYLAFDLGRGDKESYRNTFSMMLIVFVVIAFFIVIIAEILGPWLIGSYLVIPAERLAAAQWVFQISLLSLLVRFSATPYSASIVAHERMSFYAYLSIIEAVLKLVIVYALVISPLDRLVFYALLLALMDITISAIYIIVCSRKWEKCHFRWYWNKDRFKEIGGYIGWNTFGSLSGSLQIQAVTMVTSAFFPPVVLTSKAIADKVNNVSYSFVTNFILASSPQMVKYYAAEDKTNFNLLFYRVSKFGYYLMLIISVPLIVLMPDLLSIWLSDSLLDDMVLFSRLALINALVSSLETPISRAISATGNVRFYQIVNCIVAFIGLPVIILMFKLGYGAEWGYVVCTIILLLSLLYRIVILKKYTSISIREYIRAVLIPIFVVSTILGIIIYLLLKITISGLWYRLIVIGCMSLFISLAVVYVSLKQNEKDYFKNLLIKRLYAKRK